MKALIFSVLVFCLLGVFPGLTADPPNPYSISTPLPPDGIKIIPPDPGLPPEIKQFSGIWEGKVGMYSHFGSTDNLRRATLIVEEVVSPEKVLLVYSWGTAAKISFFKGRPDPGWTRCWGSISQENEKFFLSYESRDGSTRTFTLEGDRLTAWYGYYMVKFQIELKRRTDKP